MEVLQGKAYFGCIEPVLVNVVHCNFNRGHLLRSFGAKLASLNVQHQITTTNVFHNEIDPRLRLETCVQV